MTPEQWQRVRDLFGEALEKDPMSGDEWLAEAAGDPEVAAEVSSLLLNHRRAGTFLATPLVERVAHLLAEEDRLEPGVAVGPYAVVREIGRGGMGRVYLATDTRLGRQVALKALAPELTRNPLQRERLRREARAAASLTHPGICTIYALEEIDDHVLIAAEYIEGHVLREEIGQSPRPAAAQVTGLARALAAALASAHAKGITHRDLKPENVMRTAEGAIKILDFGLALTVSGPSTLVEPPRVTEPGVLIGTPAHMAPEQLKGETADARSDVFALGILLFEYATGAHPFAADTSLAVIARIMEGEPSSIRTLRPDLPEATLRVIERSLRKVPSERLATGGDVLAALAADTPKRAGGATRWWRYHQYSTLALYVVVCVIAWQIKQWQPGIARAIFLFVGSAATVAGIFRGHLLFTEYMNPASFRAERRRAEPWTLAADLAIGAAMVFDVTLIPPARAVASVLTVALAVIVVLLRVVIERSTTAAAFGTDEPADDVSR